MRFAFYNVETARENKKNQKKMVIHVCKHILLNGQIDKLITYTHTYFDVVLIKMINWKMRAWVWEFESWVDYFVIITKNRICIFHDNINKFSSIFIPFPQNIMLFGFGILENGGQFLTNGWIIKYVFHAWTRCKSVFLQRKYYDLVRYNFA